MEITSDYIEDYINHQLPEEERIRFDERLISDALFAEEVKRYIYMINSFDETQAQSLLRRFEQIEEEIESGEKRQANFPVYLRWAATVAVIATLSVIAFLNVGKSDKDLFLAYYTVYPNVDSPISRAEGSNAAVWVDYESGNYQKAYRQFHENIRANKNDDTSWFYLGICAIELDLLQEAEEAFEKVSAMSESKYKEQAQWYLALNYLKAEDKSRSKATLNEIILSGSSYGTKAQELLLEL